MSLRCSPWEVSTDTHHQAQKRLLFLGVGDKELCERPQLWRSLGSPLGLHSVVPRYYPQNAGCTPALCRDGKAPCAVLASRALVCRGYSQALLLGEVGAGCVTSLGKLSRVSSDDKMQCWYQLHPLSGSQRETRCQLSCTGAQSSHSTSSRNTGHAQYERLGSQRRKRHGCATFITTKIPSKDASKDEVHETRTEENKTATVSPENHLLGSEQKRQLTPPYVALGGIGKPSPSAACSAPQDSC